MWRYRPVLCSTIPTFERSAAGALPGSNPSTLTVAPRALAVALEDLDGGRLAGAVGPEQAEHLAAAHLELDPANCFEVPIGLAKPTDLDSWIRHVFR